MTIKDIIFVKGNLVFKSGDHRVKDLVAYATKTWEQKAETIIDNDLIVTDKNELMPYSIYCASGDICTYGNFISGMQRPIDVIRIFNEEIGNLQKLKRQEISSELEVVLNRQVYIGVVGTMELFLCDFLYCMVMGYKKYYRRFCENSSRTFKLKEISTKKWRIQDAVGKSILETNYHRINEIKKIYKKILDIEFPSSSKLEKQILTRHSLVHRNGFPSKDSEYIRVDSNMIEELITEVQTLINYIIRTRKMEIHSWFPSIETQNIVS
ncbi:MAG: hypothetical protein PHW91_07830 [Bacteroidales bacterium]|nr:hypothetical protein [Bacteroidales bacterium]